VGFFILKNIIQVKSYHSLSGVKQQYPMRSHSSFIFSQRSSSSISYAVGYNILFSLKI